MSGALITHCVQCKRQMFPRYTLDGYPQKVSIRLMHMDPRHFFCSLQCAARYGCEEAARAIPVSSERMAVKEETERRQAISIQRRRRATTGRNR